MKSTQKRELLRRLSDVGWKVAETVEVNEWWADEVLCMTSEHTPQSARFYLTFVVDPQVDDHHHRPPGEFVWAVIASASVPTGRACSPGDYLLSLGRGWARNLPNFVVEIDGFRSKPD
jgi:hypothetical protein